MESKKINQLATEMSPAISDLTIIGDPITGVSKKITLLQIADLFQTTGTVTSVAVTESGNALSITGSPITTAGTINIGFAGSANQYVRGDGALAPFPTSSGGGSSVSYYLNGSVNQGTFGGSTYYQMSKDAVIGVGTNFSTSSNGLIAQFITDANDPDVVQIPSGNWNIEFFMNVSASSGSLASFYVEIYKYNGSTFTLLATNSATPEELTNTTTVDAYYTSVAMPTSALSVTDRLAIRIYANVASKTVTLYTEDNRLCQVVTTFSKGMSSLNNLTDQSQFLATGTSGTDFNIVSSGDTHTFNIPSASATNRGLITTGSQTIAGSKTFSSATLLNTIYIDGLSYLKHQASSSGGIAGYTVFNALANGVIEYIFPTLFKSVLDFNDGADYTYTFPAASGTLALTSNLSSYVPYTGANADVDLGINFLKARTFYAEGNGGGGSYAIKNGATPSFEDGYTILSSNDYRLNILSTVSTVTKAVYLGFSGITATRTFTLPDLSGTLALLESAQTFTGKKTFSNGVNITGDVILSGGTGYGGGIRYNQGIIQAYGSSETTTEFTDVNSIKYYVGQGSGNYKNFVFDVNNITLNATRTYSLPDATGTIALTSDLGAYVTLATTQTISGAKTFGSSVSINTGGQASLSILSSSGNSALILGYVNSVLKGTIDISATEFKLISAIDNILKFQSSTNFRASLIFSSTADYSYTYPAATGTLALTSNLSAYLPLTGGTLTGALSGTSATFSGIVSSIASSGSTSFRVVNADNSRTWSLIPSTNAAESDLWLYYGGTSAGTKVSFVNNGNVLIGSTTDNGSRLQVTGAATFSSSVTATGFNSTSAAGTQALLNSTRTGGGGIILQNNSADSIYLGTANWAGVSGFGTGTTDICLAAAANSSAIVFATGSSVTERMRITSGGFTKASNNGSYLGSTGSWHEFTSNNATNFVLAAYQTSTSFDNAILYIRSSRNTVANNYYAIQYYHEGAGAYKFQVADSGNVTNTNNSYGAISDIKLKENITDATPKLDDLLKVKIKNFNFIGSEEKQLGVIAQELEEIFPSMIDKSEDFEEVEVEGEDGEMTKEKKSLGTITKSVKYSVFVPMLIKAIQELKLEIDELKNK